MPQLQTVATDEQLIAQQGFDKYVEARVDIIALQTPDDSFDGLAQSTSHILNHALWLAQQKEQLSRKEYRKLLHERGWKNEDRKYLNVASVFKQFLNRDLTQIEPATIFRLANNPKKYQDVIDQLQNLTEINQSTVRELIAKQPQPRESKLEFLSIWRRTKNGERYCQIPPIQETDEKTGTTLQRMMDEEGLTAQRIVAEAIALRQAYKEGRLMLVESLEPIGDEEILKDWETKSSDVWDDNLNREPDTEVFEEYIEGAWTFEPEPEKDNWTEDYEEYTAVVEPKLEYCNQALGKADFLNYTSFVSSYNSHSFAYKCFNSMSKIIEIPVELTLFQLPNAVQERLQFLLDRQDAGEELTRTERLEAEGLVELAEFLSLLKLQAQRVTKQ